MRYVVYLDVVGCFVDELLVVAMMYVCRSQETLPFWVGFEGARLFDGEDIVQGKIVALSCRRTRGPSGRLIGR
jgi:hypothetical protein